MSKILVLEGHLVENIYDEKRDAEIKEWLKENKKEEEK